MANIRTIVSLVPSWTETIFYLGMGGALIGRTSFCIHPKEAASIPKVGGTKNIHLDKICAMNPDIVIANKEENVKEQIDYLRERGIYVWVSDVDSYRSALSSIMELGTHIGADDEAHRLTIDIQQKIENVTNNRPPLRCCYLIWKNPYMTIGGDTYIDSILALMGYTNVFNSVRRYPKVSVEQIVEMQTDCILLSSEPYPFKTEDAQNLQRFSGIPAVCVDGEVFSWYGSKMLDIPDYASSLEKAIQNL